MGLGRGAVRGETGQEWIARVGRGTGMSLLLWRGEGGWGRDRSGMDCYESSGDRNVPPPLARLGAAEVEADGSAVAA